MDNTAATEAWEQAAAAAEADLTVALPEGVPLFFRRIAAGAFLMGQRGEIPDEEPVHCVTIPEDFYIGTFPVTQAQYRAMAAACLRDLKKIEGNLGADPSHFKGDRRPVEQVSWDDARCVCRWLTESGLLPAGWIADLPSETQWEYACREGAGGVTDYWSGNGEASLAEVGWFGGNAGGETHPVGEKNRPNPFGLHDLHGNVAEWCLDYFDPRRYRKRVESDVGTALLDLAEVEFEGANPTLVAWTEMLGRFSGGDFELRDDDRAAMRSYCDFAKGRVDNGDTTWETDFEAAKSALRTGKWPEPLRRVAEDSRKIFQDSIDSSSGATDPLRVLRGGAWDGTAGGCRSAFRNWYRPGGRDWTGGFRLALVPGPVKEKEKPEPRQVGTTQPGRRRGAGAQASRAPGGGATGKGGTFR